MELTKERAQLSGERAEFYKGKVALSRVRTKFSVVVAGTSEENQLLSEKLGRKSSARAV